MLGYVIFLDRYAITDQSLPSDEFTGYTLDVFKTGEVAQVSMGHYSKKKGGYWYREEKWSYEEGFQQLLEAVFNAFREGTSFETSAEISKLQQDHPDLWTTLKSQFSKV